MTMPLMRIAAALAALLPAAAPAQVLIDNVNGIAAEEDGRIARFDAILIDAQGKVAQRFAKGERRPGDARRVDGGGRTLIPGIVDAHGHVLGLGFAALQLDLVGTRSIAELQDRLRAFAAANPGDGWILGRGWNQELWPDRRLPTAADLDAAVAGRPVWLGRVDGHASVGNSAALKAAGVGPDSQAPEGGRIERDSTGAPTGLFVDSAESLVSASIPPPGAQDYDRALAKAQALLLASGITATADMGTSVDDWLAMRRAGDQGHLNVRIMAYSAGIEPLLRIAGTAPAPWLYDGRLRMLGAKLYGDGALGSRGAWLKRPYADQPGTSGLAVTAPDALEDQTRRAAAAGFQVAIHAIGDRANAEAIAIFERLGDRGRRWRIEHAQVLDPADLDRLAAAGIVASMQPVHQVSDRQMAEARLGPSRLAGAYAWASLARSGAHLAFGSDYPVEPPNPFLGLSAAVSRQDPQGRPAGGWLPGERLDLGRALHGFTRGGAFAGFAEGLFGSLQPGSWADFVLVDRDIVAADAQALAGTRVLQTWVAGRPVWTASEGDRPAR